MMMMCNRIFVPLSTWMPLKGGDAVVETYLWKFTVDIKQQLEASQLKRCTKNLTSAERIALRRLRQCTNVAIKPANKGSAVVVHSNEDYNNEAKWQLNNHAHYVRCNTHPGPRSASEIKRFMNFMFANGQIDKYTRDFLILQHLRVAEFYLLPKIHKPGNLGRPIVSSNNALTKNISLLVDWFL